MTNITKAAQDAQYKQTIGSTNCMQCAVAYILGLPVCDVPDFSARSSALVAWEEFDAFILSRGFSSVILPPGFSPESDYLASGSTMRGTKHIVVMNDGRLVFDPHPSNDGLVSIDCIRLIAKNHLRAALQDKAGEVPDGFVLVPVEPTAAMIQAGIDEMPHFTDEPGPVWSAMIAASQQKGGQ